ncbi:MAG TPA: shikimate kinase [Alkalispirochaeta sp.]|nr:shikimate kinase [Alkalispirochaeta sp.]
MAASASIALTGLKHVGKSTIGRGVAAALKWDFVDLDDLLVRRGLHDNIISSDPPAGSNDEPSIRTLFRALGASRFGEWEGDALREVPTTYRETPIILATGGGVCDHPESMNLITSHYHVLYLRNDPVVLYQRAIKHGVPAFLDQDRPLDHFLEIARRRDVRYTHYADEIIDVAGLSRNDAVARIIEHHEE